MTKPVLLFDLGGVIVPWVGLEALAKHTQTSREDVTQQLSKSEIFRAYEVGECDNALFVDEMLSLFGTDKTHDDFIKRWESWVLPPYPHVVDALYALKEDYTLACLSNNNALHWERCNSLLDIEDIFDYVFASHLIGAAKPDTSSYEITLNGMDAKAENIVFFDDTWENIEAANALGFKTHHVERATGVLPLLKELGYIKT